MAIGPITKAFASVLLSFSIIFMNGTFGVSERKLQAKVRSDISSSDEAAENSNTRFITLNRKAAITASNLVAFAYNNKGPYLGVSGEINIWYPRVMENERSFSLVGCGKVDGSQNLVPDQLSISMLAGWGVSDKNKEARIFVGYVIKDEGHLCIDSNDQCDGFIQFNHSIVLGTILKPASIYGDPKNQYGTVVDIFRDHEDNNWWVSFDGIRIGHFDSNILTNSDCDVVMWGGLVQKSEETPSPTEMGNGHFPNEGPLKTGEIVKARVYKDSGIVTEASSSRMVTDAKCYDLNIGDSGDNFLYGGPGSMSNTCY